MRYNGPILPGAPVVLQAILEESPFLMSIQYKLLTIVGLLSLALWACRPTEVVIEETPSPTQVKERSVVQTVVVTVEKTVVVAERETVQVVVTSTPTPIPEGGLVTRTSYADAQTVNPIMAAEPQLGRVCRN